MPQIKLIVFSKPSIWEYKRIKIEFGPDLNGKNIQQPRIPNPIFIIAVPIKLISYYGDDSEFNLKKVMQPVHYPPFSS